MKGLLHYPHEKDLEKAYLKLRQPVSEENIALYSQWSRLDARLGEILVGNLILHWQKYSPLKIHQALTLSPWPASLGVLLEFMDVQNNKELFKAWKNCCMAGVPKADFEIFYFGTMTPGGKLMQLEVSKSTKPYLKWGYFGQDYLTPKPNLNKNSKNKIPKKQRMILLNDLLKKSKRFLTKDYINLLNGKISVRVAQKDLASLKGIKKIGNTKARLLVSKI